MQEQQFNKHNKKLYTFEEAIELTGNGKFQLYVLWTAGFILLGLIMESQNMGLVLPLTECELLLSKAEKSIIGTITLAGFLVAAQFWGFMADIWGRRKVLLLSLGSGFTFSAISSFSVSSTMLIFSRFMVGATISGVSAAAISYLSECHCNHNRARSLVFVALFMSLSMFYQGIMGLFVMPMDWQFTAFGMVYRPWRAFILLSSSIHALTFVCVARMPESPKFMLVMGKPDEALHILKIIYRTNNGALKEDFPVHRISAESIGSSAADIHGISDVLQMLWLQTKPLLQKPHIKNLSLLCILNLIIWATVQGYFLWFPHIMSLYYENMELSITTCSAVDMVYNKNYNNFTFNNNATMHDLAKNVSEEASACRAIGNPITYIIIVVLGIVVASFIGLVALVTNQTFMRRFMTSLVLIGSVAAASLYWTYNFYLNVFLMCLIMANLTVGCVFITYAGALFPTEYKGMAVSLVVMFGRLGGILGGFFVGAVLHGHCGVLFSVSPACLAVAALLLYYMLR